jgi:2-C-methyl-D-erythritol 4-phosphate cytidylyltransferase
VVAADLGDPDHTGPVWAVVVAAGNGIRFGGHKQFAPLAGRELTEWSLDAARQACGASNVVLVVPGDMVGVSQGRAAHVVAGGTTRAASVRAGLAAVPPQAEVVVVHDAARPLSGQRVWTAAIDAIRRGADAAVPCLPVTDTIKQRQPDGRLATLRRDDLLAAQTPQAFRASVLRAAHASSADATDDASLVEAMGGQVVGIPGDPRNLKVTTPLDLSFAEVVLTVGLPT